MKTLLKILLVLGLCAVAVGVHGFHKKKKLKDDFRIHCLTFPNADSDKCDCQANEIFNNIPVQVFFPALQLFIDVRKGYDPDLSSKVTAKCFTNTNLENTAQ